jgi:hypothetical protein
MNELKKCFQICNFSFNKRFVCHCSGAFKLWIGFRSDLAPLIHGGQVIIQAPSSADFRYMPDNAIRKDAPSTIETPKEMTQVLIEMINFYADKVIQSQLCCGDRSKSVLIIFKKKQSQLWNGFLPTLPNQIL